MGIKEEIFEEFFSALQQEKEVPASVLEELRKAQEGGGTISEGNVLEIVKRGCEDVGENKEN